MTRYRSWPPRSTSVLQKWWPTMPLPTTTRVSATPCTSGTGGMVSSRRVPDWGAPPSKNLKDDGGIANYLGRRTRQVRNPRDLLGAARLQHRDDGHVDDLGGALTIAAGVADRANRRSPFGSFWSDVIRSLRQLLALHRSVSRRHGVMLVGARRVAHWTLVH